MDLGVTFSFKRGKKGPVENFPEGVFKSWLKFGAFSFGFFLSLSTLLGVVLEVAGLCGRLKKSLD